MSLDEGVSRLIGHIYESAAIGSVPWHEALDGVLARTGGRFAFVSVVDTEDSRLSKGEVHGVDNARFMDGMRDYYAFQNRQDPTLGYALANPRAGFVSLPMVAGGRDYAAHPFSRWLRDALGSGGCTVRYTAPFDGLSFAVSINTPADRPFQTDTEQRLFLMLFEHMERAMRIATRRPDLTSRTDALFLINGSGRVCARSEAAERLLIGGEGIAVRDGRLHFAQAAANRQLGALLRSALEAVERGSIGGTMRLAQEPDRPARIVRVSPLPRPPSPFDMFRPAAIVQVIDSAGPAPGDGMAALADLFALTPAECRVAALLRLGLPDELIARRTDRRLSTVRSHVKAILAKTEMRSKAELAHLLTLLEG